MNSGAAGMAFVVIPAGKFRRGSTPEQHAAIANAGGSLDPQLVADELPARMITISRAFEMSVTEVTQAQYEAVMGDNPSRKKGPQMPVTNVSFDQAERFCRKLTVQTSIVHRLPTEAEWEYACRAGSDGIWCFGDNGERLGDFAWFKNNSESKAHPVGSKKPNAWGLCDMHGNVWEWCSDWFATDYYAMSPDTDPKGPATGEGHVVRGGAALDRAELCRCAEREFGPFPKINLGFRVVREK